MAKLPGWIKTEKFERGENNTVVIHVKINARHPSFVRMMLESAHEHGIRWYSPRLWWLILRWMWRG